MRFIKITVIALLGVFAALSVPARGASLTRSLESLVSSAHIGNTEVSFAVIDLNSGKMLALHDASRQMIPASNTKLITVAAALDTFGKDFKYHTRLNLLLPTATRATNNTEHLLPSLLVIGDGDPAFGDPVLLRKYGYTVQDLLNLWVSAIVKTKIKHFGAILIDDHIFDQQFVYSNWPRRQRIRPYSAQVAGLDFHLNCLSITPVPSGQAGGAVHVKIFPPAPFLPQTNTATTSKNGYFIMDRKLGTNHLIFSGHVSEQPSKPYLITVDDPPIVFGKILKYQLKQKGITVDKVLRPADLAKLATGKTIAIANTALPLVLARCAKDSQNLYAESMFKRLGHVLTGKPGSWKNGAAAIKDFLQKKIGHLSSKVHIVDGSGMSRSNQVTAHAIAALLQSMYDSGASERKIYIHSLSHAGVDGTLQNRLVNLHDAQVYAKSGYLWSVSALSGYILLNSAKPAKRRAIAFSFLFNGFKAPVNNHRLKVLQDQMVRKIIEACQ